MFSVSQIKNIKTQLLALLMMPAAINCSMVPNSLKLSDKTVVSAKLPKISGVLIAGAGLVGAAGIKTMFNSEQTDRITLGISVLSLAGAYATYKYLNGFTPVSKYEKATKIIESIEDKLSSNIWKDVMQKESNEEDSSNEEFSIDLKQLLNNISREYLGETHQTLLFLKKDMQPLSEQIKQVEELITNAIKHLSHDTDSSSKNWLKTIANKDELLKKLKKQKTIIENIQNGLTTIDSNIRESDKNYLLENTEFNEQAKYFNKTNKNHHEKILRDEEITKLKSKNAYFNASLFNTLLSNSLFLQNFLILTQAFSSYIVNKIWSLT